MSIDTRVPPSTMHEENFADVVGKEPVVLVFATPRLCQSRVCGPVVDVAEQLKAEYGDQAEFIHCWQETVTINHGAGRGKRRHQRGADSRPVTHTSDSTR